MTNIQTGSFSLDCDKPSETKNGDTSTFTKISFPTPFADKSNVVVVPMVQTFNGRDTPGVRIADVTNSSFKIRFNEVVGTKDGDVKVYSDGKHPNAETVGWIAFSV